MSEEFWCIGIIKECHKKIKNNLWIITLSKKDATHIFERVTPELDTYWIAHKYNTEEKAKTYLEIMRKEKFMHPYKFKLLHFKHGKLLDDSLQENTQ